MFEYRRIEYSIIFFCRVSQPSKTVDNNYVKQPSHTKEKRRDDDDVTLVVSDSQPKGLLILENLSFEFLYIPCVIT